MYHHVAQHNIERGRIWITDRVRSTAPGQSSCKPIKLYSSLTTSSLHNSDRPSPSDASLHGIRHARSSAHIHPNIRTPIPRLKPQFTMTHPRIPYPSFTHPLTMAQCPGLRTVGDVQPYGMVVRDLSKSIRAIPRQHLCLFCGDKIFCPLSNHIQWGYGWLIWFKNVRPPPACSHSVRVRKLLVMFMHPTV
ncbi:hypothetical protein BDV96DRAFT_47276 [Lophiotrema nucula]|uniref:Uncharacterized protein n=1 Tax=Lophiotrema nucula TaxID=690887 RepID=A0A6A5Z9R3_9PLEO|nr:hypothetical protein BDV96DRAFT_47276 [Lophiotrema nucula]